MQAYLHNTVNFILGIVAARNTSILVSGNSSVSIFATYEKT